MSAQTISRRKFLTAGCVAVAGIGLTIGGGSVLIPGADPSAIDLPSFSYGDKTMTNRVLVTYASRAGSTAGVAQAIGKTLAESGAQVDVLAMKDVQDLTPYQAVIAGSAIRKSQWLPEAMQFIQTHRAVLAQKPFATFTVCITLAMSNTDQYRSTVAQWIAPVRALVKPRSEGLFAGMLDFAKLPLNLDTLLLRATVAAGIFPQGDRRDWNAIRAWAASTRPLLLQ